MTKRRKKKQQRSLSDKGDNSSGNSSSDQSLTAISNNGKCTTDKENKKVNVIKTEMKIIIPLSLSVIY
jgi:hypothetical protein